ncbi:geranylgeranyl diphosphate synthase, type II [Salinibacillus kushneri]|uniref:Farnesyl diphosphate synthase n=1 Tax=Salinibacillus kushneri TaxID=237682 RepID=A0A1I0FRB5_9BACI|nr:farnesyl diphosphate synthase [Salinibacillus kushneri]SET60953.1 geranylgeranyl diphosphate synthase, type II [Salinibacillus kushneri]
MVSQYINRKQKLFNHELTTRLNTYEVPAKLKEAMYYSLDAGGKRLRPILMMAAFEAYSNEDEKVHDPAFALEMVHTYSLIHDDLPAMDNDDYRRGKPTSHKKFDEATAILAGDALLTTAFQVINTSAFLTAEEKVFLSRELSQAAGPEGMVAGQILDLNAENRSLSLDEINQIHLLKTGKLIRFAIRSGAYLGGATPPQLELIDEYATYLGLIFQIQDDILDVIGNEQILGKPIGSDEKSKKSTYPSILGLEGAKKNKEDLMNKAIEALTQAKVDNDLLYDFVAFLGNRDR